MEKETRKEQSSFVNKETSEKFPVSQKNQRFFSGSQKPEVSVKTEKIILIGVLVIVSLVLIYTLINFFENSNRNVVNTPATNSNEYATKTSESAVSIDLTPKEFRDGKFYIDIYFNTHTVSLDQFDLTKLIALEFDGKSLNPSSVPSLSGHHSSGTLVFDTGKKIDKFKIAIQDIPDIEERVFEWP